MVVEINLRLDAGERINKATVAKQQLETAITLLFKDHDYVPIHTLAGAASQVLEDLCYSKGITSESYSLFANYVADEKLSKEGREVTRRHRNFFKHADSDPENIIRLPDPRLVDTLIYQGITDYKNLGFEHSLTMRTYFVWFLVQYPESMEAFDSDIMNAINSTHAAIKDFSRSDLLRFGLIHLHMQKQEIEESIELIARLEKSTKKDVKAIIEKMFSFR